MIQKLLITLVPLITLTACLHQADNPRDIASQYWQALKSGDTETARKLVSTSSQQDFDNYLAKPADEKAPIGEIKLGPEQTPGVPII